MTKKDESPEEGANPYWSDELLAVLAEALGDEDRARQTLEGIIQQAQEGKAMQTLSTERLALYLTELYGRIAEGVQNSGVKKRRSLDTKSGVVVQAATAAIDKAHSELLEELLEERVAMAEELAERKRELTRAPASPFRASDPMPRTCPAYCFPAPSAPAPAPFPLPSLSAPFPSFHLPACSRTRRRTQRSKKPLATGARTPSRC